MTEEVKDTTAAAPADKVVETTTADTTADVVVPTYTVTEQEAIKYGWKPKDQWEGEPDEFRPAKEFMERASFFKKINDLNRKVEQSNKALTALKSHHDLVYQRAHEEALTKLKDEHRAAVEAGDVAAADKVIDKMDVVREDFQKARETSTVPIPQITADFEEFTDRNNNWYSKDDVMTAYADRVGFQFAQNQIAAGQRPVPAEVFKFVEQKVREKFPDRFGTQKRTAPNPVGGSNSPTPRPKSQTTHSEADLPVEAKKVMDQLVRQGVMKKEQYLKEFFGNNK